MGGKWRKVDDEEDDDEVHLNIQEATPTNFIDPNNSRILQDKQFRTIASSYYLETSSNYKGAHGITIVHDVLEMESFNNVKQWLSDVMEMESFNVSTMTKLVDQKVVNAEVVAKNLTPGHTRANVGQEVRTE
ncbi:hypothetical protein Sjap_013318 [Stephania japonica]|uniref:Uncharacterized protein n=1 Tax=Stephania japonica TaxID=461633 RepID=A0AAP0P169_9MAGN